MSKSKRVYYMLVYGPHIRDLLHGGKSVSRGSLKILSKCGHKHINPYKAARCILPGKRKERAQVVALLPDGQIRWLTEPEYFKAVGFNFDVNLR